MAKKLKSKPTASKTKSAVKQAKISGVGTALKKAAQTMAKKVGVALPKKGQGEKKASSSLKKAIPEKKLETGKGLAVSSSAAKNKKEAKLIPVWKKTLSTTVGKPSKEKTAPVEKKLGKKLEKAKEEVAVAKQGGKNKKKELILEVPAPKGVALLGKEGEKKKGKGGEASVSSVQKRRCREPACDHDHVMAGYCRLHYIKNWRKIKRKEAILASGQLNNYVEELVSKYPDKYLDVIRQDLASEKDWAKVVVDLELESPDEDAGSDEDLEGVSSEGSARRGGERDFDDDSDSF